MNTKDGKRDSAAVAFLRPALERPNLMTNAQVTKVEMEGNRATGVTYTTRSQPPAKLLSGGTISSPHILLSGIGDPGCPTISKSSTLTGVGPARQFTGACHLRGRRTSADQPCGDTTARPAFMRSDPRLR